MSNAHLRCFTVLRRVGCFCTSGESCSAAIVLLIASFVLITEMRDDALLGVDSTSVSFLVAAFGGSTKETFRFGVSSRNRQ